MQGKRIIFHTCKMEEKLVNYYEERKKFIFLFIWSSVNQRYLKFFCPKGHISIIFLYMTYEYIDSKLFLTIKNMKPFWWTWYFQFCNPRRFWRRTEAALSSMIYISQDFIFSFNFLMQQKVYQMESFTTEWTACFFSL